MKPGDDVEVRRVWAHDGPFKPPLAGWFGNYKFVARNGDIARVQATDGVFIGSEFNYKLSDVRVKK